MGEYFEWVNVDKKEYITPGDFDKGQKLFETTWKGNSFLRAFKALMSNEWKGDHIVFLGDQTERYPVGKNITMSILFGHHEVMGEAGYPADTVYEYYHNLSAQFKECDKEDIKREIAYYLEERKESYCPNEYGVDEDNPYEGLFQREGCDYKYTINHTQKVYYDCEQIRVYWHREWSDNMDPLPPLMHYGYKSIGSWVGDIIDFSDEIPDGYDCISFIIAEDESGEYSKEVFVPLPDESVPKKKNNIKEYKYIGISEVSFENGVVYLAEPIKDILGDFMAIKDESGEWYNYGLKFFNENFIPLEKEKNIGPLFEIGEDVEIISSGIKGCVVDNYNEDCYIVEENERDESGDYRLYHCNPNDLRKIDSSFKNSSDNILSDYSQISNDKHFDNSLELWDVLTSLNGEENRIKVLNAYLSDGYEIKESDIKDYFNFEADDLVLREMIKRYHGTFSKETIMDFCLSGTDIPFHEIINHVAKTSFEHEEVLDILNSIDDNDLLSYKAVFEIFNPEHLDADMFRDVLDIIPDEAFKYVEKYLKLLPSQEGLEIWQDYFQGR